MEAMIQDAWYPTIDPNSCIGCGDCVTCCPTGALAMAGDLAVPADPAACGYCADCVSVCPVDAVTLPYEIVVEADAWPTC